MDNNFVPQSYASHVVVELKKRNFINQAWLSSAILVLENSSNDSLAMQRGAELLDRENSIHEACLQTILDPTKLTTLEQATPQVIDANAKQWLIGALRTGAGANFEFETPILPENPKISKYDNVRLECFLCMRDRLRHFSDYEDKIAAANDEAINTYDTNVAMQYRKESENWLAMYRKVGQTPISIESDYILFRLFAGANEPIADILRNIQKVIAKGGWQSGSGSGLPPALCANIIDDMLQGISYYAALRHELIVGGALTGKEPKYAPDGRLVKDIVAEEASHSFWGRLSQAKDELSSGNENNLRGKVGTLVSDLKTFWKKPPTGSV